MIHSPELIKFAENLFFEVQTRTTADDVFREDAFTDYCLHLIENETDAAVALDPGYIRDKDGKLEMKLNGYAFSDDYESAELYISVYIDKQQPSRLLREKVNESRDALRNFVNAALKGHLDDVPNFHGAVGVVRTLREKHKTLEEIRLCLLTNGETSLQKTEKIKVKGYDSLDCTFETYDLERLHRIYQSAAEREPIEIDFRELGAENVPCLQMPSDQNGLYDCYLAIIRGDVLADLYQLFHTRLLESNVRAFLQQAGKINKGIRDTIRTEPHMFLPYNNGLSATAAEVCLEKNSDGQLLIASMKDFQIVNGGQTTASLFYTRKKFSGQTDLTKVYVQMKLTVITDPAKKLAVVPLISRFANSQNKVSELDLSSNNAYLQKLEELSRITFAVAPENPGQPIGWYFERVKGQYNEELHKLSASEQKYFKSRFPAGQKIVKSQVSRYLMTFNMEPRIVAMGDQQHYVEFIKRITNTATGRMDVPAGPSYFEDLAAHAILYRTVDQLFGTKNKDAVGDTNVKTYAVTYGLALFHHLTNQKINLSRIWRQQKVDEALKHELRELLCYTYDFLTSSGAAMVSEFARKNKNAWTDLKAKKDHPLNMTVAEQFLYTERDKKNSDIPEAQTAGQAMIAEKVSRITSRGLRFWDGLSFFLTADKEIFSENEKRRALMIRSRIKNNSAITEQEAEAGLEILEILSRNGILEENIISLSRQPDSSGFDFQAAMVRINTVTPEDWKRIQDFGTAGIIEFGENAVVKTVLTKLKARETIELSRLKIMIQVLDKLKKFGIKY